MSTLLLLGDELISLVAVSIATLLVALVLRNPFAPTWLHSEGAAVAASLCIVAAIMVATTYAVQGLVDAGLTLVEAAVGTGGVLIASYVLSWKVFRIGERLRNVDAGRSPFHSLTSETSIPQTQAQTR